MCCTRDRYKLSKESGEGANFTWMGRTSHLGKVLKDPGEEMKKEVLSREYKGSHEKV